MTTESIQKPGQLVRNELSLTELRRGRWAHIADVFGLPLSDEQLDELPTLSDRAAADRFFPQLADVERHEVLWAADVEADPAADLETDLADCHDCACRAA